MKLTEGAEPRQHVTMECAVDSTNVRVDAERVLSMLRTDPFMTVTALAGP
jgi:hypothetical protein